MPTNAQTMLGKAFEFACVLALQDAYSPRQRVILIDNEPLRTARGFFHCVDDEIDSDTSTHLLLAGRAAVRVVNRLEPKLRYPGGSDALRIAIQPDYSGQTGDVRDVLCLREGDWMIGLSCKHNHEAVKHSRLSSTIDFGYHWFGGDVRCSDDYFREVNPVFDELRRLRSLGRERNRPVYFSDFEDVQDRFYVPVLIPFMKELERIADSYPDIPARLVHYLMGEHDFYKVISIDDRRLTKIQAVNINGTLNQPSEGHKSMVPVPRLHLPTEFIEIRLKPGSRNTVEVYCNNGWMISMRIHSAKKEVESSLKFDVQLVGDPAGVYVEMEPWDDISL